MQCQQHCLKHPGDSWAGASWTAVIRNYRNVRSKYSGSQITGLLTAGKRARQFYSLMLSRFKTENVTVRLYQCLRFYHEEKLKP